MNKQMKIDENIKLEMIETIKSYFEKERDESIGDLQGYLILEFIANEIGPYFYNKGVEDAHDFMSNSIEDLYTLQVLRTKKNKR